MMKLIPLIFAPLLALPALVFAADGVKLEVYLAGALKQSVSLVGPNASVKFSPADMPGTTLEFRLIAPEPVIVEMTETSNAAGSVAAVGRLTMAKPGSSVAVAELNGAKFHQPYVIVRPE